MTKSDKRKISEQFWFAHIKNWQESGLSAVHYCKQHQINKSTLYYWRALQTKEAASSAHSPPFIPVRSTPTTQNITSRVEYIQLRLLTGLVVQLPLSMDSKNIAQLIHAIGVPHD